MKKSVIFLLLVVVSNILQAGSDVTYSRIRIFVPDKGMIERVWESGIDPEGSSGKIGGWMEFIAGTPDLQQLAARGIGYTILVDDLQREDIKHLHRGPMNALGFGYGSMGGYYTYSEVLQQLDSMLQLYPNLITARAPVAQTVEHRYLWMVKISNNANTEDPSKPEVLFTALHHAREPEGMMTVIYYMWWLLQNYGTDPDATYLLNNRQIWFLPVFNPDGYVYNQTTNPSGGGYWRKNRKDNGDGTYGVDLNRNYGNYDMWNSSYGGSDENTSSDVYRGAGPFSEWETSGIMYFLMSHNIKTCLNYHTFGNDYVYPWGYLPWESPDSVAFREFCFDMTGYNRYVSGVDMQTVGYVTRGNSDDYMYGDSSKPVTFAMTPEVGPSFWPSSSLILPLAQVNLEPNKYFTFVAGQYTVVKGYEIADQNHDGGIERGENFTLTATLKNKGLGGANNIHAVVSATDPHISWTAALDSVGVIPARSDAQVVFSGKLNDTAIHSGPVSFIVTLTDTAGYLHRDTLRTILGTPVTLLADNGDSGTVHWNTGIGWGITSTAHSAPNAFTDSPSGDYSPSSDNTLTLIQPIHLAGYTYAELRFWTQWQVEPTYDFGYVAISSDAGTTWTTLRTSLSHSGSGSGVQTPGTWGYDGYTPGMEWVGQEADISAYAGADILLRFGVKSDSYSDRDGMYVDDIAVLGYRDSMTTGVFDMAVQPQWNLLSLPVSPTNGQRAVLFPAATTPAYSYESGSGYLVKDTLEFGRGYWLRFTGAATQPIIGSPVPTDTIPVYTGWNMIGSVSNPVRYQSVLCDPPGLISSQLFGYSNGYQVSDTIWPGKGYWVKMSNDAHLILSSGGGAQSLISADNRIRIEPITELPPALPIGISSADPRIPGEYRLEPAYPNPFNPATMIRYQLPVESKVTLKVYNLLGGVVATLIDGVEAAGYRAVTWNAARFASGIYIYKYEAAAVAGPGKSYVQVGKVLYIK